MKRTAIAIIACVAALAAAQQGGFTFRTNDGNVNLRAKNGLITSAGPNAYKVTLTGGISASAREQGLSITSSSLEASVLPAGRGHEIRTATANGGSRVTQTATAGSASRTTVLQSTKAVYQGRQNDALITATGSVRITDTDPSKRQHLVTTGSSGTATVVKNRTGSRSPLRSAKMNGPVRVEVRQAARRGESVPSTTVVTGSQLTIDNTGTNTVVTVTGNVNVTGTGPRGFSLGAARVAILTFSPSGELIRSETRS